MLVKLNDLTTLITKGTTPTTIGCNFTKSGVNFIKVETISNNGTLDKNYFSYIDIETHNKMKRSQLNYLDLVISIAGNLGRVAVIEKNDLPANTNQAVGIIRLNHNLYNVYYIKYLFQTTKYQKLFLNSNAQSIQKNINLDNLANIEIELPSLEIQNKIVNILSNIDNQIERNNAMTKRLQVLGNTIYSKIMEYPKTLKLLGELVEMYQPETITSDKFIVDGDYPVYGAGGIIGFYNKYNHENPELMVSCRGVCGKAEISLPKSFIIGNQMVIKPKNQKLKYFLYNYLLNCDLSCVETGSVQKQITRTNLAKLQILLPNEDIISEYYNVFESIYTQKTKIILETEKLNQLKNKLLPLLINGQLSV